MKDIAAHLGPDFWRLRLGIGRPADRARMIDYVLEKPAKSEMPIIQLAMERSLEIWPMLKNDRAEAAMLKLHTKT